MEYREVLEKKLKSAERRVKRARKARQFKGEGDIVIEIAQDRISELVTAMTRSKPLEREEYLDYHGQVTGIKYILSMLDNLPAEEKASEQEMDSINEQIKQFEADKKQQS